MERVSETERKFYEYSVHVGGVFGRNRKAKSHSFTVLEAASEKSPEEIRPLVEAKLTEIKAKPGLRWAAYSGARTERVVRYSDGTAMRSVSFMAFGDTKLFEGAVA